ncbi:Zn(2)-C6 fungal-type domain-containing protein [Favolaschia claudopus]|uniref:Zn(2)-C6 fungal-type domain-containing protein n=1 Tax=Favolaschia claudopus TaxID=2862362 RepID=A0AAW0C947_9AGAR
MCSQCSRYPTAFSDCAYDEQGPSQSQLLEEQISILQTRIEELKRPQTRRRPSASTLPITPQNTTGLGPLLTHFYLQQTSGSSVGATAVNSMPTELPFIVLQALVHNFLHSATSFGFFLDTQAFHDVITSPAGKNLPPVLLNVLYLFGVHLSEDPDITVYEPAFLAHALRSTASSLTGSHPRTILHSIQAEVLLAYYFIRNARFLEGKYHISAAVSIVLSAGLHRIRSPHASNPSAFGQGGLGTLPPPRDAREEGERIAAFWAVLSINNCWAHRDGTLSNISYHEGSTMLTIDTPWPLENSDYVEQPQLLPKQSTATVENFLRNEVDTASSCSALYAKASLFFEEASRLSAQYRSGGISPEDREFLSLNRTIDVFIRALPSIDSKRMFVVHNLAYGAVMQLNEPLMLVNPTSFTKILLAARAIVSVLAGTDIPNVGLIDPILAPVWTTASLAFVTEIERRGNHDANDPAIEHIQRHLSTVISTMENFAPHCRLMALQLEAVKKANEDAMGRLAQ